MKRAERKIVFVSGTGTGIGKTFISAILAEALQADYWKPVQAGYASGTDSAWVRKVLTNKKSIVHPETYLLELAASPHIGAHRENIHVSLQKIVSALPAGDNDLIIEGAGGLMVPLNDHEFVADLIRMLNVPVALVSRNTLGSINFSLLTAMACKQKNIRVLGWVFNDNYLDYENDIVSWTNIPSLASVPFASHPDSNFISEQAKIIRKKMENWQW
ncbi:MAG: dethiobiotin synthase [Chitinophagaceae bacterium]|nr:dethiobiotin synthase [Chitinophagaceae bacterium]